jgi:Trp operon repressor
MVNVSKKALPKHTEKELCKQLSSLITAQQRIKDSENLIFELFTPSERIQFVKRVGIIALLQRNYSHNAIAAAIRTSDTTVAKIAFGIEKGGYKTIRETLKRKEHAASILGILESLVSLGVNPQKRLRKQIQNDIEAWKAGA